MKAQLGKMLRKLSCSENCCIAQPAVLIQPYSAVKKQSVDLKKGADVHLIKIVEIPA